MYDGETKSATTLESDAIYNLIHDITKDDVQKNKSLHHQARWVTKANGYLRMTAEICIEQHH